MRHMYNEDGMIAYAGKARASSPWKGSRYRPRRITITGAPDISLKAAEVELDTRTHKERISDILRDSKWSNPAMNREG